MFSFLKVIAQVKCFDSYVVSAVNLKLDAMYLQHFNSSY